MCVPNKSDELVTPPSRRTKSTRWPSAPTPPVDADKRSEACKVVLRSSQPAHIVMIVAVATVAYLWRTPHHQEDAKPLLKMLYFGAFCVYMGSQFWMTFVSGLALFFTLPRHHFADVQRVLFPTYFALNSALTLVVLVLFAHAADRRLLQMVALAMAFLLNLGIRLYLTPPLLQLIDVKNALEKAVGVGMEVGSTADVGPLRNCPHYARIRLAFRRVHTAIAFGNVLAIGCTVLHLIHLSQSICAL